MVEDVGVRGGSRRDGVSGRGVGGDQVGGCGGCGLSCLTAR